MMVGLQRPGTSIDGPEARNELVEPALRRPAPDDREAKERGATPTRGRKAPRRRWKVGASALSGVAPFDRYPPRQLRPLAAHADRLQVPEGTVIAREGGLVHELVVVVAGEVRASRRRAGERRHGPGTRFGARELVSGAPHPDTLVAGPGLEVVVVNGPAYRGAAQILPGLAD